MLLDGTNQHHTRAIFCHGAAPLVSFQCVPLGPAKQAYRTFSSEVLPARNLANRHVHEFCPDFFLPAKAVISRLLEFFYIAVDCASQICRDHKSALASTKILYIQVFGDREADP